MSTDTNTRIIISAKDEASRVFNRVGMEAEGVTRRVNSLGSAMGGLAAFSGLSGIGMSVASAVDKFGQFETALTDMGKVSDRDLGAIRTDIESINPVLGSSTELMRGYYQTISAGVTDPVKSVEMLTVASKASQAAHVTQSETIKALTKVMAGYGDEIETASEASDLLFAIERQGQTSFSELVPVIGDLANISNQAAVSTNEMGASMALLTQTSGSTAEAATKYKAMLVNMLKPTKAMSDALASLGYESGNALIADKGVVSSLKLLQQYADKSGVSISSLFESSEAFMGVSALLAEDGRKLAANIDAIGGAAGSTDKAFEKWSKTSDATRKKFDSVWDNSMKTFGEAFAPEFNKGLDHLSDWITDHGDEVKDLAKDVGQGVNTIGASVAGLYDFYNTLPDGITGPAGAGIIGRYLLGSWGLGSLLSIGPMVWDIGQGLAAVSMGHMSWGEFSDMNGEQLRKRLDSLKENADRIRKLERARTKDAQILTEGLRFSVGGAGVFGDDLSKQVQNSFSTSMDGVRNLDTVLKASEASIRRHREAFGGKDPALSGLSSSLTDKEKKARERAQKELNRALTKLTVEPYEFERKQIQAQKAVWKKAGVDHVELVEWETFALREIDEKYNAEKLRRQAEFNSAFADEFIDPYLLERRTIREQARIYREDGNNKVKVSQWEKSQLAKLEREHTKKVEEENKKRLEEEKQAAREKLLAHGTFFDGIALGYEDMLENQQTWAERGYDIFNDFATSSKSALGDIGFDALTGKMKSFSDYWDSFWSGMARSITNHLADMAVNKGLEALVGMGGGLFDMAGTFFSNYFHTGNMRVGADEVAAILQTDEIVIPAKQSDALRQVAGSDGMSKGTFFDNIVDYAVTGKQYSMADRINNSQRDMFGWDMLGVARDSALIGISNAVQNWTTIGQQASFLREQGMDISQSAVSNAQYNYALSGLVGSFFPTFAGNLMGSWGNRAMGMNDSAFSLLGFDISSANIGNVLGSAASILLGGPAAPIVSGVLSPVFSMVVSGLADAFDVRENETIRDMLDDKLGSTIASNLAYQAFKDSFAPSAIDPDKFSWGFSLETFSAAQIADLIAAKMEAIDGIARQADEISKVLASAHLMGPTYISKMMSSTSANQSAIADAIQLDPGFFSSAAREFSARTSGVGFAYGEHYYTATGQQVDRDSWQNPNSDWGKAYAQAISVLGYSFGEGMTGPSADQWGGLGSFQNALDNYFGGNWGSWINDSVSFGERMQDFAESLSASGSLAGLGSGFGQRGGRGGDAHSMGRDKSQGGSGVGAAGTGVGGTGLRRHGGPAYAGDSYLWQERGLPGEIFMPQTNGFVLNHEVSEQFIAAVRDLVAAREQGVAVSSGDSGPLVVNLHLDGQQLAQIMVPHFREASANGEQFVYADTVIEAGV